MWDFPYDSPKAISALLKENELALSKKFGQNFLLSLSAIERIVDSLKLSKESVVWEVGPGIGALTSALLQRGFLVVAFEIDYGFSTILQERAFRDEPNFRLIVGDVLKTWLPLYKEEGPPDAICSNLPYNIGSIFIARLLEEQVLPPTMVYTVQREVGQRLLATVGDKNWSTLSLLTQCDYFVEELFVLKGGSFYPPPKVDSSVIRLTKRESPLVPPSERALFFELAHTLFAQRRKTVRNNLLHGNIGKVLGKEKIVEILKEASIKESERGENLGFSEILSLTKAAKSAKYRSNSLSDNGEDSTLLEQ